jgi:hypothetical protein
VPPGIPLVCLQKLQASFRKIDSENHQTSQKSIQRLLRPTSPPHKGIIFNPISFSAGPDNLENFALPG